MPDVIVKKVTVEYVTADGTKHFRVDFPAQAVDMIVFNHKDLHTVNVGLFAGNRSRREVALDASKPLQDQGDTGQATSEEFDGDGTSGIAVGRGLWWYSGTWFHPQT
jgi:hypothetical protein